MTISAGTYRIRNVQSGTYLDASLNKRGTIHGWTGREGQQNQEWEVQNAPNGRFTLRNVQLGTFATVSGQSDGTRVQAGDHPTAWEIKQENQGYSLRANGSEFVADLDWGKDENGTSISLYRRDNRHNQQLWQFQPVSGRGSGGGYSHGQSGPPQQQNWQDQQQQQQQQQQHQNQPQQGGSDDIGIRHGATYALQNGLTGTRLDLAGGKGGEGVDVLGWQDNGGNNQRWVVERSGNGWKLRNAQGGTYLGFSRRHSPEEGTKLSGQPADAAPEWIINRNDLGYQLVLASTANSGKPLALDLEKGEAKNGAHIILWGQHSGQNQRWRFEEVRN